MLASNFNFSDCGSALCPDVPSYSTSMTGSSCTDSIGTEGSGQFKSIFQPAEAKALIEQGYDKIAHVYLAWSAPRPTTTRLSYLNKLLTYLPSGAHVLELGCGAGVPCTQSIISHGMNVTGVDISATQIALAHERVPEARLIQADMMSLSFPPSTFDAVVAFYSIFHLPREEQGEMIGRIKEWLKEGGWLLCNFHTDSGDHWRENWFSPGVTMFSSGLGVQGNRDMFRKDGKGLTIVKDEVAMEKVGRAEERFHWLLAVKHDKVKDDAHATASG
jgi:SAM-dependent methyltransferase